MMFATNLLSTVIFTVAQLPPLFWSVTFSVTVFTLTSILSLVVHLIRLIISFWGMLVTLYWIKHI